MATKTSIANRALNILGQNGVTNISSDDSDRANLLNNVYDSVLDEILSETMWNFSVKRANLTTLDVTIPWTGDDLSYAYLYPSDCIRILDLDDNSMIWRVEVVETSKCILTDNESLGIRYIFRNTNTAQYHSKFINAFSYRLATELAFNIDRGRVGELWDIYLERILPDAISANSQEGSPIQPKQDHFLNAKYGMVPSQRRPGEYYRA